MKERDKRLFKPLANRQTGFQPNALFLPMRRRKVARRAEKDYSGRRSDDPSSDV